MRTVVAPLAAAWIVCCAAACATGSSSTGSSGRADVVAQARPLSEVLQGCSVEDDGARMRCSGVSVIVHEGAWPTTFEERAQKQAEDNLAKAVFDDVTVDVLGRAEPMRRARISVIYGGSLVSTLLFAKGGGGRAGARTFTCEAPAEVDLGAERCVEILASYLAESPVLTAPSDDAATSTSPAAAEGGPRVAFGPRMLPLLPGCRSVSAPPGGRLECRAAVVTWRPFKTMPEAVAAALDAAAPYRDIGNAELVAEVPCRIVGEAAQCSQAKVDGAEPFVLVVGVAYVDGVPTALTCRAAVEVVDATVCGGLVAIDR